MKEIQCAVCNKTIDLRHLWSHLRKHNINYVDYQKQNLDQFSYLQIRKCKDCNKEIYINNICDQCSLKYNGVICRICNKIIRGKKGLCYHLKSHNIKFIDYVLKNRDQFSNWINCKICGKLCNQKSTCSIECNGKYISKLYKNNPPFLGKKHTKEAREKNRNWHLEKYSNKENHPWTGKHLSKEHKYKIGKTRIKNGSGIGKKNGMFGKTHSEEAIRKIFSHRKINKVEKLVADILDENNIKYYFQYFITKDKICKSYDFKIKDKPIIIEVDGDFWHGGPGTTSFWKDVDKVKENDKIKENMADERGIKIIRFWQSELKNNTDIVINRLKEYL